MSKCITTTPLHPILRDTAELGIQKSGCAAHVTCIFSHATRDAYDAHQCVRREMYGGDLVHEFHSRVWRMGVMSNRPWHWTTRLSSGVRPSHAELPVSRATPAR